jgi:hypothetical protein
MRICRLTPSARKDEGLEVFEPPRKRLGSEFPISVPSAKLQLGALGKILQPISV